MKTEVTITAVWLRRIGDHAEVWIEMGGKWRKAISEYYDGNFSHIAEATGWANWEEMPVDDEQKSKQRSWDLLVAEPGQRPQDVPGVGEPIQDNRNTDWD